MEGVHLLADHGASILYLVAIPYRLLTSIQWLFASQALCLSFTAIPLWYLANQAGLKPKLCWLICLLWWLQPVVFNVNLFDFHPEVLVMPALAGSFWASRANKPWLWFILLITLITSRDGLILVIAGIGLEQALRKRWAWAGAALGISLGWLGILNKLIYPVLTGSNQGPKAVSGLFSYLGNSIDEIIINLFTKPELILINIDWLGGVFYLILILIGIIPFLNRNSFPVLVSSIPLVFVNLLSQQGPQRTLIHHYSLPIAVIVIIGAIDGISNNKNKTFPWKKLTWNAIFWAALAKPWFFTGPYLSRLGMTQDVSQALIQVDAKDRVLTTSYLVPHLSQRLQISFPEENHEKQSLSNIDVLLLNTVDPGWGSTQNIQAQLINEAKKLRWDCKKWESGLELCKNPIKAMPLNPKGIRGSHRDRSVAEPSDQSKVLRSTGLLHDQQTLN